MSLRSQRVTQVDLANGRIRLPHDAKALFPVERADVVIVLRGQRMTVRFDPRWGPDQERSGVLTVGRSVLPTLVAPDDVLQLRSLADGAVELT